MCPVQLHHPFERVLAREGSGCCRYLAQVAKIAQRIVKWRGREAPPSLFRKPFTAECRVHFAGFRRPKHDGQWEIRLELMCLDVQSMDDGDEYTSQNIEDAFKAQGQKKKASKVDPDKALEEVRAGKKAKGAKRKARAVEVDSDES